MSLLKKIGKALAITALSAGLMHNVIAEPIMEPTKETTRDAGKYKNLFMVENQEDKNNNQIVFRWKRAGEEYDARCIYDLKQMKNKEIFLLRLKKAYEDKNRDGKFSEDEVVNGEEYRQFKIMGISENFLELGRDEDNNSRIDRTYGYKKKHESPTIRNFLLYQIKKDLNNNGSLEDDEIIWQNWLDF